MIPIRDENPVTRAPIVTVAIIVACIGVYFAYQAPSGSTVIDLGDGRLEAPADVAFTVERAAIPCEIVTGDPLSRTEFFDTFERGNPEACLTDDAGAPQVFPEKRVWLALLTSIFLHGGPIHLGLNMLFLWIFGNNIEDRLGPILFGLFYIAGGVVATMTHVGFNADSTVPLVGASGAIAAVMGAYLVWFPLAPIRTLIMVFFVRDITARWFLGFWFALQFLTDSASGVAWVAHVGGFVFGAFTALLVRFRRAAGTTIQRAEDQWDPTGGIGRGPYPHFFDERPPDYP